MKLYFREKIFTWFDSYDIFDENRRKVFQVKGKLSWGHKLVIYDAKGNEVGMVKEKILDILPTFDLYMDGKKVGSMKKKLTILRPKFDIDFNGWEIDGNWMEWDYSICDKKGRDVAVVSKALFHLTDHYKIDVKNEEDALGALMVVLAIDAEKCRREKDKEGAIR